MDEAAFREQLARDGFTEVLVRDMPPGAVLPEHTHAWDSRLMVLAGEFRLERAGVSVRYVAGHSCEVPRDEPHAETYGTGGTRMLIGRRHP